MPKLSKNVVKIASKEVKMGRNQHLNKIKNESKIMLNKSN